MHFVVESGMDKRGFVITATDVPDDATYFATQEFTCLFMLAFVCHNTKIETSARNQRLLHLNQVHVTYSEKKAIPDEWQPMSHPLK